MNEQAHKRESEYFTSQCLTLQLHKLHYWSSGVGNGQVTSLQVLLTNVAKLEDATSSKIVKASFSTKDRDKAEKTKQKAWMRLILRLNKSTDEKSSVVFDVGPDKSSQKKPT